MQLTIASETVTLHRVAPFTFRHLAEDAIRTARRDAFRAVMQDAAALPPDLQAECVREAVWSVVRNVTVTRADVDQFLTTPSGNLLLFTAVAKDVTPDKARELFSKLDEQTTAAVDSFIASCFAKPEAK